LCEPSKHNAGFQETRDHSLAYYEVVFMQDLTRTSFKNILFLTDFSPAASPALAYSLALARHFHARLYPAHVMEDVLAVSTGNHDRAFGLAQEQTRRQLLRLVEYNGVGYEPLLSRCDFENAMHHWIAEYGIDLIVVGTQGHTGRQRGLLGSTAELALDNSFCPVLTVGPNANVPRRFKLALDKILFPTDLVPQSGAAVACALALASDRNARLMLFHVLPEDSCRYRDRSRLIHFAMSELNNLLPENASTVCKPECAVDSGEPLERILNFARTERPDLIVMGRSHVANSACRLRSGVAYGVISAAPCPVLTIQGEGKID
jgi:nucleotide-binding universal stress UspA family protein